MSATSVNGWPVLESGSAQLRRWTIPGTGRALTLCDGPAGFLQVHNALWFDEVIERLDIAGDPWDEWGHAVRPVRGQTSGYSNHASGTADDLNATRHPMGVPVRQTFTDIQIRKITRRMRLYAGCLVWGGTWSRPDGMHFEIAKDPVAVKRVARLLMLTPRGRRILAANPGAKRAILS